MLLFVDVIRKNYSAKALNSEDFKSKFKNLTEGLRVESTLGRYWTVITLARWSTLCIILVTLRGYYMFQIVSLLMQSVLVQTLIIHGQPMLVHVENKISLFNEIMVSLFLYVIITLTEYNQKVNPLKHECGMALVAIIVLTFSVNVMKAVVLIYKAFH